MLILSASGEDNSLPQCLQKEGLTKSQISHETILSLIEETHSDVILVHNCPVEVDILKNGYHSRIIQDKEVQVNYHRPISAESECKYVSSEADKKSGTHIGLLYDDNKFSVIKGSVDC